MRIINYFQNNPLSDIQLIEFASWVFLSLTVYFVSTWLLKKILTPLFEKSKNKWDDLFIESGVIARASLLIPTLILLIGIRSSLPFSDNARVFFERLTVSTVIMIIAFVFSSVVNAMFALSQKHPLTKDKPLKSIAQAIKVVIFAFAFVLILSTVLNRSPWVFISGIGAMTAVVLLVFKDSILGLVAGIQLSALDMVRVGDWIEVPAHNVDGDVMDITLNTVKVRNFDKTITTIPPTFLTGQAFKNYRGMVDTGARRIKRSIMLDQSSIVFADQSMLQEWQNIELIQTYLVDKQLEIAAENQNKNDHQNHRINGRAITNIGTFRKYVENYLKKHPKIAQHLTMLVRQLPPTEMGLPIEIYAFVNNPAWLHFEEVQSDIFDHLLASVPSFGLRIFQSPAGFDFKSNQDEAF